MEARVDCTACRHFFVTWRSDTPRACRLYGFEGLGMPSAIVRTATGEPCRGFEAKGDRGPTTPAPIRGAKVP